MKALQRVGEPARPARPSHARVTTAPRRGMATVNGSTGRAAVPIEDYMMDQAGHLAGQVGEA